MQKRKSEEIDNVANKKEKKIPFSSTDFINSKIKVGDKSALVYKLLVFILNITEFNTLLIFNNNCF